MISGPRRIAIMVGAAVLALGPLGCAASGDPVIEVGPATARADQPVTIRISGLRAGAEVQLAVRSTDADKITWESTGTYTAGRDGVVDPAVLAPTAGTYTDVDPMGLLWSMQPVPASAEPVRYAWPAGPATFTITASLDGRAAAARDVTRTLYSGGRERQPLDLDRDGFIGSYRPAAESTERRPAVLLIGGAEGGLRTTVLGDALAERGLATLSVAYFGLPGLPETLNEIPLETFEPALRWLRRQPGVDPDRIWTMGVSRGSEPAQLLAAQHPDLIHGVLATVPSGVVVCGFPDCDRSAWTLGSKPLPYGQPGNPEPAEQAAIIPVGRIDGPVLAVCGGADQLWPSCRHAESIMNRLDQAGHPEHRLWSYPEAGHGLGGLLPYTPVVPSDDSRGTSPAANKRAEAEVWPQVIDYLLQH
ncbi:acyl-CoA thioesterase/bile acid-CoA:amino acid N-acyltransferase family protein [Microlunatus sp. GCM10028923]|uniref:acyl-CoA thioesterase/bile acid-CoA:amino acid N-acyltransferase family protein n=1 Tax=Microlunatus sp. GCM10028923 TaxID=3273400 RepID=UPI003611BA91